MQRRPLHAKRRSLAALATLAAPALLWAQVSLYQFSESNQPYTEITFGEASYSLGEPTYWPPMHNLRAWVNNEYFGAAGQITNGGYLSGVYGPGYPIGFDFSYNGDVFDRIGVANGGWISLGKSSDGNQAVWCFTSDHSHGRPFVQSIGGPDVSYKRNRIAGFGSSSLRMQDQSSLVPPGPVSTLYIATIGTAPNRTCVIQYKDFRASYSSSTTLINFQIRLNEADNSVEVRYGDVVFGYDSGGSTQVGLGGRIPEDFNSRMTVYEEPAFLYDWNFTSAGLVNSDACLAITEQPFHPNGSGVPPVQGLNFKWTPDACPAPAWPLSVVDISFDAATAQWGATGVDEYEYFVSGTNDINGLEITSGTTPDPEAFFFGLEPATDYYVFVRSICGGEAGGWSLATHFLTKGGGIVMCDGAAVEETYCSHQNDTVSWLYVSADGSPLRIELEGGYVGNNALKIWDGPAPVGNANITASGNVDGFSLDAASGQIYIQLVTDNGSCETQPWYLPLEWRVGCKNCTDPLANFELGDMDCDNQQYYVDVNVFAMGSATSLTITNDLGVPPTVVTTTGVHSAGPFPAGQSVMVTAQNPDNVMCYSASAPIINEPCAIEDCGPTTYTYCYSDNEQRQWAYQGEADQEIGIRFLAGTVGLGDQLRAYNGLDLDASTPQVITGGLANRLITSGLPFTDRAVVLELQADNAVSCADEDPLYGSSQEWEYVVACYDGCTQPQATFTRTCLNANEYEVVVNITQVGSEGATITNDGGAAPVTVTGIGEYTVGPFASASTVTLEVEGASILCTWTSAPQTIDCTGVGIGELDNNSMAVFPNPSSGTFHVEFPQAMQGQVELLVLDLTGRVVSSQGIHGATTATLELGELPNGLYTLVAQGASNRVTAKISIQH